MTAVVVTLMIGGMIGGIHISTDVLIPYDDKILENNEAQHLDLLRVTTSIDIALLRERRRWVSICNSAYRFPRHYENKINSLEHTRLCGKRNYVLARVRVRVSTLFSNRSISIRYAKLPTLTETVILCECLDEAASSATLFHIFGYS